MNRNENISQKTLIIIIKYLFDNNRVFKKKFNLIIFLQITNNIFLNFILKVFNLNLPFCKFIRKHDKQQLRM